MKKLALVLVLLLAVTGATQLFAQGADFSSLPSGSWLDSNYNGTWTFSASGITIKCNATGASNTFTTSNIQSLRPVRSGLTAGISFASSTFGKTYNFYPNLTDGTILLTIDREGQSQYSVTMRKQ
ncbi:MAG: hypothetical protein FWB95_08270 [Treponema sp.]|nr:hypothetical protein [Treponema sp.]